MIETGIKSKKSDLYSLGLKSGRIHWNYSPAELYEESLRKGEGILTNRGSLMVDTSYFTGRAPKDKYVVIDEKTKDTIWWGPVNQPIQPENFNDLYNEMIKYLYGKELYVRDGFAGADHNYRLKCRFVNTMAWQNLFCYNMFIRPAQEDLEQFIPDFTVICAPEFTADPQRFGLRQSNFAIVNLSKNIMIIGGTAYAGEIKKGIFGVMNYILPLEKQVLPMHCAANVGKSDDTAIFFGLSGTGKTTLSADPNRMLIGDDEHGWASDTIFNFEGGCYAKTVDLSEDKEPDIWNAIKFGAIEENLRFFPSSRIVNYSDTRVTENTRVSYPIDHIKNAIQPSIAGIPKNIFFLAADAFGILPPISKLNPGQAMYHFISGYTAKVAGTEVGIKDPVSTFSACFGAAFLPLPPTIYAEMLGEKMKRHKVNVWLVNTGWIGGKFGVGKRIDLRYTRAMISAALEGKLDYVEYHTGSMLGTKIPTSCPGVPSEILRPKNSWSDQDEFYRTANRLVDQFHKNFEKFRDIANDEIMAAAPRKNTDYE